MLRRMNVPVTGIVENMAGFVCGHCGELTEIFGRGGGERFAREHGIEFLGSIPLDVTVRQGADVGIPAVAQREPGPAAAALTALAQTVAARMSVAAAATRRRSCRSPSRPDVSPAPGAHLRRARPRQRALDSLATAADRGSPPSPPPDVAVRRRRRRTSTTRSGRARSTAPSAPTAPPAIVSRRADG